MSAVRIALLLLIVPRFAAGDDTVFDFVAPRADQVGAYAPGAGAVVTGGVATLAPIAGWLDESWAYRRPLTVQSGATGTLEEWPLALALDASASAAAMDVFARGQATGADLRVVDPAGAVVPLALGLWEPAANRGLLWFRPPAVAPGAQTYLLYFGHPTAAPAADTAALFTYSTPYAGRYLLDSPGTDASIVSLVDGNAWVSGARSGTLDAGDLAVLAAAEWAKGQAVATAGPAEVAVAGDAAVEAAPVAFAATRHAWVVSRGAQTVITLLSPFADATATVTAGGVTDTLDLVAGTASTWGAALAANTVVSIDGTAPVLAAHRSSDPYDGVVLAPPAAELWGFRSGTPRIVAVDGDAEVTVWGSAGGAPQVLTAPAGGVATLAAGTDGAAEALHVAARDPVTGAPAAITVVANGDGDGGDEIVFHRAEDLGRAWAVPVDARYVAVALSGVGATCTLTPPAGAPQTAQASVTTVPPWPGQVQFGADAGTNVPAGSLVACDEPGFAYLEDAVTDDERNLHPMESHRKRGLVTPGVSLGGPRETRYPSAVGAVVDTPDFVAPTAVAGWTGFRAATFEPPGASVAYLVSVDGGATWLKPVGGAWSVSTSPTLGASARDTSDAIATLRHDTDRLRVRAVLQSHDGVSRPEVDAVRVFYDATDAAVSLHFAALPGSLAYQEPVALTVSATTADGTVVTGRDGPVVLTASHGGDVSPARIDLVGGIATASVTIAGVADDVTLHAVGPAGIAGDSEPFDLLAPDGATLELESGDGQFGTVGSLLGAPLVVRARDATGAPLAATQVTFAVTAGGGSLEPGAAASVAVLTDADGLASVWLRLGASPGEARVRAQALGSAAVDFHARGDEAGAVPPETDESGCSCRAARAARGPGAGILFLLLLGLLRKRAA